MGVKKRTRLPQIHTGLIKKLTLMNVNTCKFDLSNPLAVIIPLDQCEVCDERETRTCNVPVFHVWFVFALILYNLLVSVT